MDFETADRIRQEILANNPPEVAAVILGQRFTQDPDFFNALHHREIAPGVRISNPGPDAATMTERYLQGVSQAASRWVQGMQNPRRDPKQAALRAAGKWANRTQEAIQQGSYAAGIQSYDLAEAVQVAVSDGGSAYTAGAAKRSGKVQRMHQRLAPLLGGVSQAIQSMPQDTEQQREQRLLQARRMMLNVGKQLRGGGTRP
jgi:hypothetical protein